MYARNAYLSQTTQTRVDLILEVYERLLNRLRQAQALLASEPDVARGMLNQCQLAVTAMAAGQDLALGELAFNFARLYEFAAHAIGRKDAQGIHDAIDVLQTLQAGFLEARPQALSMERAGQIPALDQGRLQITA